MQRSGGAVATAARAGSAPADSPAPAPAAARPGAGRRRKRARPAGSKWLNRLLALGCLASLLPLCFEWYQHRSQPAPLARPRKDDPWVRVIDATPPDQRGAAAAGGVNKRWRHHPRHGGSSRTKVGVDGTVMDEDSEEAGEAEDNSVARAARLESRLRTRGLADEHGTPLNGSVGMGVGVGAREGAPRASELASNEARGGHPPVATATAARNQSGGATGDAGGAGDGASSKGVSDDDDDDLRHYFREVDRAAAAKASNATRNATRNTRTDGPTSRLRAGGSFGGPSRLWRVVPGGVHDVIEGSGPNQTVFSVDGIGPPVLANGSYVVDTTGTLDQASLFYLNRNLTWVDRLTCALTRGPSRTTPRRRSRAQPIPAPHPAPLPLAHPKFHLQDSLPKLP